MTVMLEKKCSSISDILNKKIVFLEFCFRFLAGCPNRLPWGGQGDNVLLVLKELFNTSLKRCTFLVVFSNMSFDT